MTATSSVKPKSKFSSRNANALYKAPALRGADVGGASAGFRTGGVNGLNRMLVLRGPVRGGALGLAAPTPINTPSLRKEHMGQDIHVSLVPATKGGGWGSAPHDDDAPTTETMDAHAGSRDHQAQHVPAAPRTDAVHHQETHSQNAWTSGAPPALVAQAKPPAHAIKAIISVGSGRWGDDAVEEDFVQGEIQRDMQHRREFPDLHELQAHPVQRQEHLQHPHTATHHDLHNSDSQWPDGRPQTRKMPLYDDRASHREYDNQRSNSMHNSSSSMHNIDERGNHNLHVSVQDVRFGSSSSLVTNQWSGRPHAEAYREHPRYAAQELSSGYGHGVHNNHIDVPQNGGLHRSDIHDAEDSRDHGATPSQRPESTWKANPNAVRGATTSPNVWKMSEAEVSTRSTSEVITVPSSFTRPLERSAPEDSTRSGAPMGAVRILKRDGPRMLFDHKSGTMVEVNEPQSSRRSSKPTPAQRRVAVESSNKVQKVAPPVDITKKESKAVPPITRENCTSDLGSNESSASESASAVHTETKVVSSEERSAVIGPVSAALTQAANPKSRKKESKTKLVPMGGKMKRVLVAYRPVVKSDIANVPAETPASEVMTDATMLNDRKECLITAKQREQVADKKKSRISARNDHGSRLAPSKPSTVSTPEQADAEKPRRQHSSTTNKLRAPIDTKKNSRVKPTSKGSKVGAKRVKRSTRDQELNTPASIKDETVAEEMPDDGGGEFTTVKSRRAILLERKKQREQLAAALAGFHERCDVKRPSNRVTVPASIARFGRKGLLVGFKEKKVAPPIEATHPIPVLEKSFLEVIRPPILVRETEPQLESSRNEDVEHSQPLESARNHRKSGHPSSKRRSEKSTERHVEGTHAKAPVVKSGEEKTPPICSEATVVKVKDHVDSASSKSRPSDESVIEEKFLTSETRQDLPEKRMRNGAVKKEVKKIYVPKVTQTQRATQVVEATTTSSAPHSAMTDVPPVSTDANTALGHDTSRQEVSVKKTGRKTKTKQVSSHAKTETVSTLSTVPAGQSTSDRRAPPTNAKSSPRQHEPLIGDQSREPVARTHTKKVKSATSLKGVEQAPPVQKSPTNAADASSNVTEAKPTTNGKFSNLTPTPPTSASSPPRRPVSFKGTCVKSITTNASSQKIFKQIYVVKTTSTAAASSPSAA